MQEILRFMTMMAMIAFAIVGLLATGGDSPVCGWLILGAAASVAIALMRQTRPK